MKTSAETHCRFEDEVDGKSVEYRLEIKGQKAKLFKGTFEMHRRRGIPGQLVQPKVLEVLAYFLRHSQQELERDAIIEEIWPDDPNGGGKLDHYVSMIRKLLQDQPPDRKSYRLLVNIRDRGFKFLKPVAFEQSGTVTSKLEAYRRKWHHYHLTLDDNEKPVWIYKIIDFRKSLIENDRLSTEGVILRQRGGDRDLDRFTFELFFDGPHLVLWSRRFHDSQDIGIDLFPHVGGHHIPRLFSARIHQTWNSTTFAGSIGIMGLNRLGKSDAEGPVIERGVPEALLLKWNTHFKSHPKIVQLPFIGKHEGDKRHSPPRRMRAKSKKR
jgi:DNA-binding winged helix-turn-helix (wHTH) protein